MCTATNNPLSDLPHAPRNPLGGFWAAMKQDAAMAWPRALSAIAEAAATDFDTARRFLDSRWGRHFADDVLCQMRRGVSMPRAISGAIECWMTWEINPYTAQVYELPRGLPYLLGFLQIGAAGDAHITH